MHHFQSCDQPRTEGKGNKLDKPDSDIHKQWRKSSTKVTSQFQMAAEVPERRYPSAAQAGLKLLASSDPLTSASQNVGITGVSHYASPHCLSGHRRKFQSPRRGLWGKPLRWTGADHPRCVWQSRASFTEE
ncbi:uncharacterized protein LOC114670316 isoform X2 [Macaca mulatta]